MTEFFAGAIAERQMRTASAALDQIQRLGALAAPDDRFDRLADDVDVGREIAALARGHAVSGAAREVSEELRHRFPNGHRDAPATFAWRSAIRSAMRHTMTRADVLGTLSAGGYLGQTLNFSETAPALMAAVGLSRLGMTVISSPVSLALTKVSGSASPYWLSTETSAITESDQVFGQLALAPHNVGGYTEISRLGLIQSNPDVMNVAARNLVMAVGHEIEKQTFSGTGVAGTPHGLAGYAGVNSISGSSYNLATGMQSIIDTGDALSDDACPGFAANKSVASLLRQRQEFSASTLTLWRGPLTWGSLHDFPAFSTSGIASGTAFFGLWRYLVLCDFGGGISVDVNPYGGNVAGGGPDASNFKMGLVGVRAMATVDVGPIWPAAFSCISGIT